MLASLLDDGALFDPIGRLRAAYPNTLAIERPAYERAGAGGADRPRPGSVSDVDLFEAFFGYVTDGELGDARRDGAHRRHRHAGAAAAGGGLMRPLRVVMQAFGPYAGEQTLDFAELRGASFFLITGPTGSGKTTVLDAMSFALYGVTSGGPENEGGRSGAAMRSDHADPRAPHPRDLRLRAGRRALPDRARARAGAPQAQG